MSTIKSSAENLTLNADGSGNDIIIQSDGSTKAIITAESNVGIAVTPETDWTVYNAIQIGGTAAFAGNDGTAVMGENWKFADGNKYINASEASRYYTNNGNHVFQSAPSGSADAAITWTTVLEALNTDDVKVTTGNLVIGTAGKGIDFSANTNDATPDSGGEVLDDYEEGTWTPAWDSDSAGSGRATTVSAARYTKIGNVVHISAYITLATLGTGGSGPLMITGLPFTSVAEYGSGINIHSATGFDDVIGAMSGFRLQNADARINIRGNDGSHASPYGNNLYWANYAKVGMAIMFTGTYWAQ